MGPFSEILRKAVSKQYQRRAEAEGQLDLFGGSPKTSGRQTRLSELKKPATLKAAPKPKATKASAAAKLAGAVKAAGDHAPRGYRPAKGSKKGGWTDGRGHYWYPGHGPKGASRHMLSDEHYADSAEDNQHSAHSAAIEEHGARADDVHMPPFLRRAHAAAKAAHEAGLADPSKGLVAPQLSRRANIAESEHHKEAAADHEKASDEHGALAKKARDAGRDAEADAHTHAREEHYKARMLHEHPEHRATHEGYKPYADARASADAASDVANKLTEKASGAAAKGVLAARPTYVSGTHAAKPSQTMAIGGVHIDVVGHKVYAQGDTRAVKEYLKSEGFRWDKHNQAWWSPTEAFQHKQHGVIAGLTQYAQDGTLPAFTARTYSKTRPAKRSKTTRPASGGGLWDTGYIRVTGRPAAKRASAAQVNYAARLIRRGGWHDTDMGQGYGPPSRDELAQMSSREISALIEDLR